MGKYRVLFMCTGNSCRSQMAEAIVNSKYRDRWVAYSGGSRPTGYVHPLALEVLNEIGMDHQGRSKSIEEFHNQAFDLVITLCDQSEDECPVWLGLGKRVHLPFSDPAKVTGSEVEIIAAFRHVRDAIASELSKIFEK